MTLRLLGLRQGRGALYVPKTCGISLSQNRRAEDQLVAELFDPSALHVNIFLVDKDPLSGH